MAAVSEEDAILTVLADKLQPMTDKIRRINRAMDRSRRATNPQMFDKDGTIIPIDRLPEDLVKNGRRIWNKSKRYMRLAAEKRYLLRKQAALRIHQHNELANRILAMGNEIYVEAMNYKGLQKKAKFDPENPRKRRKRFGKSLANRAPALFLTILERKALDTGGSYTKINTFKAKASQYNHQKKNYIKKSLSTRWNNIDGKKIQRDLYSAFLIMNISDDLIHFDERRCNENYESFVRHHDEEIKRLRPLVSSMGI